MNRKLILLNVALLGLLGALGWLLRIRWLESRSHERAVLEQSPHMRQLLQPPPPPTLKVVTAAEYFVVAQNMLFAKDRNSQVVIDPPPPPPPEPPMPALPAYHGMMAMFGDPVAFFSFANGAQKSYHTGDPVGPFKLVSFDKDKITLDWNGKTIERRPEELASKETAQAQAAPAAAQSDAAPPQPAGPQVSSIGSGSASSAKIDPKLGKDNGAGNRACVQGDSSPPGTVLDGYKKIVTRGMFGETCRWEQINQ